MSMEEQDDLTGPETDLSKTREDVESHSAVREGAVRETEDTDTDDVEGHVHKVREAHSVRGATDDDDDVEGHKVTAR